jgi:NAD(P)-dependent dehydrogenase (short-subunit alcohol dehydrogenase family)
VILDRFSLAGKVGVVTGAGQGLGKVFALGAAEAGADVVVAELNEKSGAETAASIEQKGRKALAVVTDVTKHNSVAAMVARVIETFGRIDFLVNNAGITRWAPAEEMSNADWGDVIDVNLNGLFLCCQHVGRRMIEGGGGSIINIASMSGVIVNKPQPQVSYNTSKAAVIHLTKSLAAEWSTHGVRVNSISPGYMNTPMARPYFEDEKYGGLWMEMTPMGRPGEPEELAPLAVFLASEASSFVTGANIVIDGGYSVW